MEHISKHESKQLYEVAFWLAIFTIVYNVAEGVLATYFGSADESLALFGFGIDSFIEVISGLGIAHMVLRIKRSPDSNRDPFERTALRITGGAFYALVLGLVVTSLFNIMMAHHPSTTLWGVVISCVSILVMLALIYAKLRVGKQLHSDAILADAECTRVCIYMSVVLLMASGIYELTGFIYADSIGTLGLAYLSLREGRECFEKARTNKLCSCESDHK